MAKSQLVFSELQMGKKIERKKNHKKINFKFNFLFYQVKKYFLQIDEVW